MSRSIIPRSTLLQPRLHVDHHRHFLHVLAPPNKPIFRPQKPQYSAPQYPLMQGYTYLPMLNSMNSIPAFPAHPGIHPSYYYPQQANIHPAMQLPAQMPPYFGAHSYFCAPQPTPSSALLPPMAFTGPQMPLVPPTLPVSIEPPSGSINLSATDSPSYQWPDGTVKLECTVSGSS
ncbi:hypothetical protein MVEN_00038600 [Mycena venus]|uniref:Uncharacterized protein n=1 Tax=Mycena venus TaxID=2733690 RepID=A0A8H6Z6F2_9AGAR|nr:hypothetical protein MVEN_00038600 [Mycena venus]